MKRKVLPALILFLFMYTKSFSQHCPFDGTSIIMVNILSKNQILQIGNDYELELKEINNPHPDTCQYAKGMLRKTFKPVAELYIENSYIKDYEKMMNVNFNLKGDFYVLLNMAETQCMQPSANDFTYYDRNFLIVIRNKKTGKQNSVAIHRQKIYDLCTNGKWERIKALAIKL